MLIRFFEIGFIFVCAFFALALLEPARSETEEAEAIDRVRPVRTSGNSHQRRLARRARQRAYKLGNA